VHNVLQLFPSWSKEQGSHTAPLLLRGAVEVEGPVRVGECWSRWFRCTVVWLPWEAWWRRSVCYKISEHLTLNCMTRNEVQLKLSQLCSPLSDIASHIGVVEHDPQWV
jgi:hypothetical protein